MYRKHVGRALILALLLSGATTLSAQRITRQFRNVPLKTVLAEVEKELQYSIIYRKDEVNEQKQITQNFKNASLEEVLAVVLDSGLTYIIQGKMIVISKKGSSPEAASRQKQIIVKGVVKDEKGEPVIGANVVEKGTTNGTVTDVEGHFSLVIPEGVQLSITYIGYLNKIIAVKEGETSLNILLKEDTQRLDEIIVVGYGSQKKVNLTGSVATVNFEKMAASRPITDVSTALAGMSAGVQVRQTSGQPGSDGSSIRIRGVGTLNNANPLIIVDGLESSLESVNPNDVESISILKDAASAAIYGSRAANGVILVTTKRGKEGKISVSYSGRLSLSSPTHLIDMVTNYADFMEYMNESSTNIGSKPIFQQTTIDLWREKGKDPNGMNEYGYPNYIAYPNTDWQTVIFNHKLMNEHNVSLNGATEKVSFLVSAGYLDNPGLVDNTGVKRYSFRSNVDVKVTNWLNVGNRTYASMQDQDISNFETANGYLSMTTPGVTPVYNSLYGFPEADGESATANNILYTLNSTGGKRQVSRINTTLYTKVNFLKDFSYNFNLNYNRVWDDKKDWRVPLDRIRFSTNQVYPGTPPADISTSYTHGGNWSYTIQNLLNYSKKFAEEHSIAVLLGHEEAYYYTYQDAATKKGLIDPSLTTPNTATDMMSISGSSEDYSSRSFFGRLDYNFKQRYLFEANVRYDGSSRFDSSGRYGIFPSFSAAWRISEENFMKQSHHWLDNLKIRASWGKLGNNTVQVGNTIYNYPYMSTYNKVNYVIGNAAATGLAATSIANPLLEWESTAVTNVGVDMTMFQNRLTVELEGYYKSTDGILYQPVVYYTMGNKTAPFKNIAAVRNSGFEVTAGWNAQAGNVNYYIKGNFTFNVNKVAKFKGKYKAGWINDNEEKIYQSNIGEVSTGGATRILEGKKMNEYYLKQPYQGDGSHFNQDGSVNIKGGPKDGMIRTEGDMDWLKSMVAAGYIFYPNQSIDQSKIWYGDYIYADANGDGIYGNEHDNCFTGTSDLPKYNFGFQLGANWKGLDISMNWAGAAGFNLLWGPIVGYNSTGTRNGYSLMKEVAQNHYFYDPTHPDDSRTNLYAKYPRLTCNESSSQNAQQSTLFLYNGNYLKLKNLTIGYTLPAFIAKKVFTQSIRFYFSGENLWTITAFPGQDPEMGATPKYASIRQIAFGTNITF